jgi:hypothetical protein
LVGVALLAGLPCLSCGPKPDATTQESPQQPEQQQERAVALDSLRGEIVALIGEPPCVDVSQCRAIAFGSKPCGGPWQYLVYSTMTADSAALTAAVAGYNAEEARLNEEQGRVSDCRVVGHPRLACAQQQCSGIER